MRAVTPLLVATLMTIAADAEVLNPRGNFSIMPWMCLERCGSNATEVQRQINTLAKYPTIINRVSYEWWDLGPSGTLINNGFTDPAPQLRAQIPTVQYYGMVTTVDLTWIREVIYNATNAANFITKISQHAVTRGMAGINFDWEPNTDGNATDAQAYAEFFYQARKTAFHATNYSNLTISVDVGSWNQLWNWSALSMAMSKPYTCPTTGLIAPSGEVVPMATYTYDDSLFIPRLKQSVEQVTDHTLVVGLMTWTGNVTQLMNKVDVSYRMGALATLDICHIAIWLVPLPDLWFNFLGDLVARCNGTW